MGSSQERPSPPCVASQGGARRGALGPCISRRLWRGTWTQVPTSTGKSMHMGYNWIAYMCQFCIRRRANARFIEMAGSCALISKGGSAFFPLSSLSWWKWDPCCWWKEPQCEGTEKKVLGSSILWHFIEDLINQINHHVTPSSSHKLVIEHGKYNCNFLGVLFRSAGALEWSLNLFDSS